MIDSSNSKDSDPNSASKTKPSRSAAKKPTQDKQDKKAKVSKDLAGFEIGINAFGEISSNFPVERINSFLNTHVPDRRLNESPEESGQETPNS